MSDEQKYTIQGLDEQNHACGLGGRLLMTHLFKVQIYQPKVQNWATDYLQSAKIAL